LEKFNRTRHWENIYETKPLTDVSWYQPVPVTSLELLQALQLPKTAKIIDVGGGDSYLVDHLLELGYSDVSVLDISSAAIARAKQRLGARASQVNWIVIDVVSFKPTEAYDLWHDRAAFHFLTVEQDILTYIETAHNSLVSGGHLIIGTFSDIGPTKCSGIDIQQYSAQTLTDRFSPHFEQLNCLTVEHPTPSGKTQDFVFCVFRK
jgi:SAM-dependent methyltransferase